MGKVTLNTPRGEMSQLGLLNFNVAHDNEMYGIIGVYLRRKGIVPLSTEGAARHSPERDSEHASGFRCRTATANLLKKCGKLIEQRGYSNISETFRDLIPNGLGQEVWQNSKWRCSASS